MINFNTIPTDLRVPGAFLEFDNTQAISGLVTEEKRILVIGAMLATGSATAEEVVQVNNEQDAVALFGRASVLDHMFRSLIKNNRFTRKFAIPVADSGTKGTGTIVVSGPATETGTLHLLVAGQEVKVVVNDGDADTVIAAAIDAAMTLKLDLPVTSGVSTATVTLTARNGGEQGNDIKTFLNFNGLANNEKTPAGVSLVILHVGDVIAGSSNPDLTNAIAAIDDEIYDVILIPYTDTTNLDLIDIEMDLRHSGTVMQEGHVIAGKTGTVSALGTFGNGRNNEHTSIIDAGPDESPSTSYDFASAVAGQVVASVANDPARPFQTLPLIGIIASKKSARRTATERNTLLFDGIATHKVTRSGVVQIERLITNYQKNPSDVEDVSFLDANTLFTLSFIRQTTRIRLLTRFPRHKLADDGTRSGAGQSVVTPSDIKAQIVALALLWEELAIVENIDVFAVDLIVERNATDPNRVDLLMPTDLVNQLRVIAASIQFIL